MESKSGGVRTEISLRNCVWTCARKTRLRLAEGARLLFSGALVRIA